MLLQKGLAMIGLMTPAPTGTWRRLFYRGPVADVLYDDYARRGRIDDAAPVVASHEVLVDAPVNRVWVALSRPEAWPSVDPDIHAVHVDGGVVEGARFSWRNGRTRLSSRFAVVDPGRELTWTGSALGAKVVHRHVLAPAGAAGTRLYSEESMAGLMIVLLFSSTKLDAALAKWLTAIASAAQE
jgi:hypothetical protein